MSISDEEIQKKLSWLTDDERLILGEVYAGTKQQEIADNNHFSLSHVKKLMGSIYGKFGLADKPDTFKKQQIFVVYGPALEKGLSIKISETKNVEDLHQDQITKPKELTSEEETTTGQLPIGTDSTSEEGIPADQFFEKPNPISFEEDSESEDESLNFQFEQEDEEDSEEMQAEPTQQPRDRRPLVQIIFGIIVGMIVMALILFQFIPDGDQEVEKTVIHEVIKEVTVEVPATVLVAAPSGLTQTPVVEQVFIVATATPFPATETPVVVPVNPPGFVFYDDFEDGPDQLWDIQFGETGMANGKYTVIAPFEELNSEHFALISDHYWRNAVIEFNLSEYGHRAFPGKEFGAVVFHYQKNKGGVGLLIYPEEVGIQFGILDENNEWVKLSGSLVTGREGDFDLEYREYNFRVEINENTYTAYLNNKKVTSATIDGYDSGLLGLWFMTDQESDNPLYYATRIEDLRIESLP